jgi:glyoxylase-like metal-dependent hydrolase (beta-lactamase superfamily II)
MSEHLRGTLRVTGKAQAEAWRAGRVAAPEQIGNGLWALALPIPESRMPSSFGYAVIGGDGVHIIDPGWGSDEVLEHWRVFLAGQGRPLDDIATVLVTHSHPDHLGLAGRLRDATGAQLLMAETESNVLNRVPIGSREGGHRILKELGRWGVPDSQRDVLLGQLANTLFSTPIEPDRVIADGEELRIGGRTLRVLSTPGHTDGHLCFMDPYAQVVFTGDSVLPQINPGIGLGQLPDSDPLGDYLRTLSDLATLDHCEVLPGHEYRFRGLRLRCQQISAHHLRRTAAVQKVLRPIGDASVWEVTQRLPWTRGFENMQGFELQSALRQTEMHVRAVQSGAAEEWLREAVASHA